MLIASDGKPLGIVSRDQALILADSQGLDLIEVGPKATPPVARLLNWGKYKYELEKKERKAKGKVTTLKEVKLSLKISEHDFETKVRRAKEFLEAGHKVGAFLLLRGREAMFQDKAEEMLKRFRDAVGGSFEGVVVRLGPRVSVNVVRKR
jgi:translation initiation factor IF-3